MMELEHIGPDKLAIVKALAHEIWPATYGPILTAAQLDYMLDLIYAIPALERAMQGGQQFSLVWEDGNAIGFFAIEHRYGNEPVTRLHKLYVLPGQHGKGVGKWLMERVLELALREGSSKISLNVNRFNPAYNFYLKSGFKVAFEEQIQIGNGFIMDDFRMEKTL